MKKLKSHFGLQSQQKENFSLFDVFLSFWTESKCKGNTQQTRTQQTQTQTQPGKKFERLQREVKKIRAIARELRESCGSLKDEIKIYRGLINTLHSELRNERDRRRAR